MKKKRKMTEEQRIKHRDAAFRKKIRTIFLSAGFSYINTLNKQQKFGHRDIEVDAVFFYENIMLISEDTGSAKKDKDHIRKKNESFSIISEYFSEFLDWLCCTFPDNEVQLHKYSIDRYKVFNLYISRNDLNLTHDERKLYSSIKFIEPLTLNYFHRITQCIKLSSRYEIFRFLDINKEQFGRTRSESSRKVIKAPIIYPRDSTGLKNGVRVVSFMISAEMLLGTCYVLRKDNWEDSIWLYQRLIDKEKIKSIRSFLANKGEAFFNNIIVGLPNNVRFVDEKGDSVPIDRIGDYENCKLEIHDEWNSICVIDGQHRIFAHYEGPANDKQEQMISHLRTQLHLLATGLIFPSEMSQIERAQIQSEIFLDINSNSKPVPADVLLHIEMIKNPFSDIGLARRVIERLNKEGVFENMFELSSIDESKIKVASIIKFALRYLVTITPVDSKESFYTYWNGDKNALIAKDDTALDSYIDFCTICLRSYFAAIKKRFSSEWLDPKSKLLSVISLNGFIIAYIRQLKYNGVQNFKFYDEKLKNLSIDFSKSSFMYTSSQYRKFSNLILQEAFGLHSDDENPEE